MRVRSAGFLATAVVSVLASTTGMASACHKCKMTPCVMVAAPAPTHQCVTEMVPFTVYHNRTKTEYRQVSETIMVRKAETTYVERQRMVCKPVYETSSIERTVSYRKPVSQTTMVAQSYTVCKPVTTAQQVTEYVMQASTRMVSVPVVATHCGHCGKVKATCGCATVAQTCYTPVPVVKTVNVTMMVPEVQTRQVPVTTTQMVYETKVETVPIRTCKIVQEMVTDRIPVTTFHCVPTTVTRNIPYPVCETVAEVKYRPMTRMVPIVYAPMMAPTPAVAPTPQASGQKS